MDKNIYIYILLAIIVIIIIYSLVSSINNKVSNGLTDESEEFCFDEEDVKEFKSMCKKEGSECTENTQLQGGECFELVLRPVRSFVNALRDPGIRNVPRLRAAIQLSGRSYTLRNVPRVTPANLHSINRELFDTFRDTFRDTGLTPRAFVPATFDTDDTRMVGVELLDEEERTLYVVTRGTTHITQWFNNIRINPVVVTPDRPDILTTAGFRDAVVRRPPNQQMIGSYLDYIRAMVENLEKDKITKVVFVGHSLGSAMMQVALLTLQDIIPRNVIIEVILLSSPQALNEAGAEEFNKIGESINLRSSRDIVNNFPLFGGVRAGRYNITITNPTGLIYPHLLSALDKYIK